MADIGVYAWAVIGGVLLLGLLMAPRVERHLTPGRREAELVHASIAAGDERADELPDGSAGVRRSYVVRVVNDGRRPVNDVVVECILGRAAGRVASANQLPFHYWRTLPPRSRQVWTPEFTLPVEDARLLSGRRPPALVVEFTDARGRGWRDDPQAGLRRPRRRRGLPRLRDRT